MIRMESNGTFSPQQISPPLRSSDNDNNSNGGVNYIEHRVSKFDTLAGVAIKYGVEVADIKKMNGLVTDHQMFALKTIQIPLPGRHPPSSGSTTPGECSSSQVPPRQVQSDLFDSFPSLRLKPASQKVSPAMSSLRGFYGLRSPNHNIHSERFGNSDFSKDSSHHLEDGPFLKHLSPHHRKSRSLANDLQNANSDLVDLFPLEAGEDEFDKWNEKLVRRRQKPEAESCSQTPEMLLKADNGGSSGSSTVKGKGLALRNKAASRANLTLDSESSGSSLIQTGSGESSVPDTFVGVRKSSSTSSLQDKESSSSSSFWSTSNWNFKQDIQALSNAVIAKPIFDGLPKPLSNRKNKSAVD